MLFMYEHVANAEYVQLHDNHGPKSQSRSESVRWYERHKNRGNFGEVANAIGDEGRGNASSEIWTHTLEIGRGMFNYGSVVARLG
ncbi:hypothetical protein RvVAR031_pl05310 (plasmid) [Agrobacterium vitis]|nr:hypothetical protein RvVAR031_pl05310 [Agrobacterium vitis]